MKSIQSISLLCCTALLAITLPATHAESWPSLDDLASEKMLLIVHCRAEGLEGRLLYKVLDVWKGEYNPASFAKQPPTGYINALGGAGDRKPGEEILLFYTRHNQPKTGIELPDMTLPVRAKDQAISYPPGYEELSDAPGKFGSLFAFKQAIRSRMDKLRKKEYDGGAVAGVEPTIPKDLAGDWRLLMTAGFEHDGVTLEAVGESRYRLVSGASRFNGIYELRDDRLVAVEPKSTAAEGYVWKKHSLYMLTLVEQSDELANDYRGAVLFRAKTEVTQQITSKQEARISNEDLNRLLPERKAPDPAKIEHHRGFRTIRIGTLGDFWDSFKDDHKMKGLVSERLTRDQIDAFWMLEVNIAIAANLGDSKYPTIQDELLAFMAKGNRFLDSPPLRRDPPPKYLVALFRTTKGDYGLITRYPGFCLIELGGYIGAAPIPADAKASK